MEILDLKTSPYWDWEFIKSRWVDEDEFSHTIPGVEDYYRYKNAVLHFTGVSNICEIGVRAGYSAYAFVLEPCVKSFVGFDANQGNDGGLVGYSDIARQNLKLINPEFCVLEQDSQQFSTIPYGPYDFIHIDGDHSYDGATHDIDIAVNDRIKWILIDDFRLITSVREAILDAVERYNIKEVFHIEDGLTDSALIHLP